MTIQVVLLGGFLAWTTAVAANQKAPQTTGQAQTPAGNAAMWRESSPTDAGLYPGPLRKLVERLRSQPEDNIHAVLVFKGDALVLEEYFSGSDQKWGEPLGEVDFNRDTLHDLRGGTKSVISALVGQAVGAGLIRGAESRLIDFYADREIQDKEQKRPIRLRHVLTMTAGLEWHEAGSGLENTDSLALMSGSDDPTGYVLDRPVVSAPGATFNYNGGLTELLSDIVGRAGGSGIEAYAVEQLFKPLGIDAYEWRKHPNGLPDAAGGLRLRPYDFAKIAHLFLENGRWRMTQLIPRGWVENSLQASTTTQRGISNGPVLDFKYGYQWWLPNLIARTGQLKSAMAWGNGGQIAIHFPQFNLLTVITAGNYDVSDKNLYLLPLELVVDYILPAAGLDGVEIMTGE
jgi:CubicO group peptidase (beta-lactamase class C family)